MVVTGEAHLWRVLHDWYAIPIFFSGAAEMAYRRLSLEGRRGHVNVLEPGEVHRTTRVGLPTDFSVVFIPTRLFEDTARELGYGSLPHFDARGEHRDKDLSRAALAFHELAAGRIDVESTLTQLISRLLASLAEKPAPRHVPPTLRAFDALLEAARAGGACPSIGELASLEGTSPRQLHRAFRQRHGVSPVELFQLARVSKAMREIAHTPTLVELAAACGFADQSHMNRVFRRVTHSTAGRYLAELRRGPGPAVRRT